MKYDVHYAGGQALISAGKYPGDEIGSLDEFDLFYRYVGTFEAANLEELFKQLQNGGGGLGDETMQKFVIRHVQHTSMFNGDIAIERDTGRIWFLDLRGWKQIDLK